MSNYPSTTASAPPDKVTTQDLIDAYKGVHRKHHIEGNAKLLEAGICLAARLPNIENHFDEQTLEKADASSRTNGLQDLLVLAARPVLGQHLYSVGNNIADVLRASFSSVELPGILSNIANKFLLEGFHAVESAWKDIATIKRAPNFKPTHSHRMTGDVSYERIAPQGEIKHGSLGEEAYENRIESYGRMFSISRQDIINDDLDALTKVPRMLGRGAAVKVNDVFWRVFLDHLDHFKTDNNNLLSGPTSTLTIDGLSKAEAAFLDQMDSEENPLGIEPSILLVPNELAATARQLINSQEIRINGPAGREGFGTGNPHQGRFKVVRSSYLTKAKSPQASNSAWYLLSNPLDLATIEVAVLNGDERPKIESADADFSTLGIQMRGYHDFGVSLQDPRGAIKSTGA